MLIQDSNVVVSNNYVLYDQVNSNDAHGMEFESYQTTISNNVIENALCNGLSIENGANYTISGNVVINSGENGNGCSGISIGTVNPVNGAIVSGNFIISTQTTPTQSYGILANSNVSNLSVSNNYIAGVVDGDYSIPSSALTSNTIYASPLDLTGSANAPSLTADTGLLNLGSTINNLSLEFGDYWIQGKGEDNGGAGENIDLNPLGGNVGIGTTSPGALLDLGGALNIKELVYGAIGSSGYQSGFGVNLGQLSNSLSIMMPGAGGSASGVDIVTPNQTTWPYSSYTSRLSVLATGNVGIGTVSPTGLLQVAGNADFGSGTPTLSSCGTSPTLVSGSNDMRGEITIGTSATGCTLTFSAAKNGTPFCIVTSETAGLTTPGWSESTTAITITGVTAGDDYAYMCMGN